MAINSKEEALAFIQTLQLTVKGKTGFTWLTHELDDLMEYVTSIAKENETLRSEK
jgi:hypothetical protein